MLRFLLAVIVTAFFVGETRADKMIEIRVRVGGGESSVTTSTWKASDKTPLREVFYIRLPQNTSESTLVKIAEKAADIGLAQSQLDADRGVKALREMMGKIPGSVISPTPLPPPPPAPVVQQVVVVPTVVVNPVWLTTIPADWAIPAWMPQARHAGYCGCGCRSRWVYAGSAWYTCPPGGRWEIWR